MEKQNIKFNLGITFQTPFHIGSGLSAGKLIDNLILLDHKGFPYIPGSSIKGRIKANLIRIINSLEFKIDFLDYTLFCTSFNNEDEICKNIDIKDSCYICRLFGSAFSPSSLIFSDFRLENKELIQFIELNGGTKSFKEHLMPTRSSNRLNRKSKISKQGALFDYEIANFQYKYIGEIIGEAYLSKKEYELFKNSIKLITHLGGNKSRGLGRCEINLK